MWNSSLEAEAERVTKEVRRHRGSAHVEVSKVSQLDALLLDKELLALLRRQSDQVWTHLPQYANQIARAQPEINACLRLVLWAYSTRTNQPSPGDALLNLRYRNESLFEVPFRRGLMKLRGDAPTRTQRLLQGLATVCLPWAWERTRETALVSHWTGLDDWRSQVAQYMDKAEKGFVLASLLNTILFFWDGRYRTLLDRLLGIRLVYAKPEGYRPVSFEFINQQLLYDGFSELVMCLLPLVDWEAVRRWGQRSAQRLNLFFVSSVLPILLRVQRALQLWFTRLRKRHEGTQQQQEIQDIQEIDVAKQDSQHEEEKKGHVEMKVNGCSLCGKLVPTMPFRASCGHVYCFFCLKTAEMKALRSMETLSCMTCGDTITASHRE